MPASMTDLLGNRRRIDIPKADGSPGIYVVYRPQSITPRKLHELLSLEQSAAQRSPISDTQEDETDSDIATAVGNALTPQLVATADTLLADFAEILIDWDLTDDRGRPIPPTLEGLQDVDYDVLSYINGKIQEDARVGKPNGTPPLTPLASTSSPQAKRATTRHRSRTGSR